MANKYLVGVDLGTSATKAALYDPAGIQYPQPGVVVQDSQDFYDTAARAVSACMRESGVDPKDVAAIAFDSQMAGVGAYGEDLEPIAKFDSWLDMRCEPFIRQMEKDHGELITRLTGCPPTCDHGPKILTFQRRTVAELFGTASHGCEKILQRSWTH